MAEKPRTDSKATPKRLNRSVRVGDAIAGALDPALKRRGFASRDIIAQWRAMAPQPYDSVALPDKLVWPRGERSATGATLYLRCAAGHQLALVHEAPRIAASNENLLLEAQPPIMIPYTPMLTTPKMYRIPILTSAICMFTTCPPITKCELQGTTALVIIAVSIARPGPSTKRKRLELVGMISSFIKSFNPSARG